MKNILCYGDSNTWGADPHWDRQGPQWRIPREKRWTGILQRELGDGYHVYEGGLCSRTTAFDDPLIPDCNGLKSLPMVLAMTSPLDLVIIMLGGNEAKQRIGVGPMDISRATEALINCVRREPCGYATGQPPKILIMAPPPCTQNIMDYEWGELFGQEGLELCQAIPAYQKKVAEKMNCAFLDASEVAVSNPADGMHLDEENHGKLAKALLPVVREILSDGQE